MGRGHALVKILIGTLLTVLIIVAYSQIHLLDGSHFVAMSVLTTDPREASLMLMGLVLVLTGMILRTRGKEDWKHRHDPDTVERRSILPETTRDARYLLRETIERKIKMANGLTQDEIDNMSRDELASMVEDGDVARFLVEDHIELTQRDVKRLMEKVGDM